MEPQKRQPSEALLGPGISRFRPAGAVCLETRTHGAGPGGHPGLLVLTTEPDPRAWPGPVGLAARLSEAGLATAPQVSICLLTPEERSRQRHTHALGQDVHLLSVRLGHMLHDMQDDPTLAGRRWAILCTGHVTAAALVCAAALPGRIRAVLSWQGRPDLAGAALQTIDCPVLLTVADEDTPLLDLNRRAQRRLPGRCDLVRILAGPDRDVTLAGVMGAWLTNRSSRFGRAA